MNKTKIKNLPIVYPIPSILAGAMVEGKPNYNTLGNCGIISVEPAVIYISSHRDHYTNKGIRKNGLFSVNIPGADLMKKLDYCGLVTGRETDKSQLFQTFYEGDDRIPLIGECPINMECKVIKTVEVYEMEVFIAEVTGVYADQACLSNGFPDTTKMNLMFYCMDNLYWNMGQPLGTGFHEGIDLMK
jgi:flavin reductase (DIM6/NTAB) family NADH-FMN oxidoreductase RutF